MTGGCGVGSGRASAARPPGGSALPSYILARSAVAALSPVASVRSRGASPSRGPFDDDHLFLRAAAQLPLDLSSHRRRANYLSIGGASFARPCGQRQHNLAACFLATRSSSSSSCCPSPVPTRRSRDDALVLSGRSGYREPHARGDGRGMTDFNMGINIKKGTQREATQ